MNKIWDLTYINDMQFFDILLKKKKLFFMVFWRYSVLMVVQ